MNTTVRRHPVSEAPAFAPSLNPVKIACRVMLLKLALGHYKDKPNA